MRVSGGERWSITKRNEACKAGMTPIADSVPAARRTDGLGPCAERPVQHDLRGGSDALSSRQKSMPSGHAACSCQCRSSLGAVFRPRVIWSLYEKSSGYI
jgi:hypothetical protein